MRMTWDVRLHATIGEPLVGFQCKKSVSIMCRRGIIFCDFSKVPPVSDSEEEENMVLIMLR